MFRINILLLCVAFWKQISMNELSVVDVRHNSFGEICKMFGSAY